MSQAQETHETDADEVTVKPVDMTCTASAKLKRSKSFYTPANCSTPKLCLSKELEFLNILYNEGSLNDSQTEVNNEEIKKNETISLLKTIHVMNSAKKSYNMSPIVNNYGLNSALRKSKCVQESPLELNLENNKKKTVQFESCLENINRNLSFEDDNSNSNWTEKKDDNLLRDDDEELLAHCNEVENMNGTIKDLTNNLETTRFETQKDSEKITHIKKYQIFEINTEVILNLKKFLIL
jgi:hypothetical protein